MRTLLYILGKKADVQKDFSNVSIMLECVQKKQKFLNQLKTVKDMVQSKALYEF